MQSRTPDINVRHNTMLCHFHTINNNDDYTPSITMMSYKHHANNNDIIHHFNILMISYTLINNNDISAS